MERNIRDTHILLHLRELQLLQVSDQTPRFYEEPKLWRTHDQLVHCAVVFLLDLKNVSIGRVSSLYLYATQDKELIC
jgi:hypothetical protein